jgi:hypothetical protein
MDMRFRLLKNGFVLHKFSLSIEKLNLPYHRAKEISMDIIRQMPGPVCATAVQ